MNREVPHIEIRRYQEDLVEDLRFLFNQAFKPKVSREYLLKKYSTAHFPVEPVATLAYHQGEPVACYGALPFPATYQGRRLWIAHACDSITLPAWQRKGLHQQLALQSYAHMREQGFAFVFAMHSEATFAATLKLGWQEQKWMARFHLPTGKPGLNRLVTKIPGGGKSYQKYVKRVLADFTAKRENFKNSLQSQGLAIDYNPDFLAYKCFTPNHVIRIGNCLLWLKVAGVLSIGATLGLTSENVGEVLEALKNIGRRLKVKEVMFHISRETAEFHLLSQHIEPQKSWLVGYLPFDDEVDVEDFRLNYADLDTF